MLVSPSIFLNFIDQFKLESFVTIAVITRLQYRCNLDIYYIMT